MIKQILKYILLLGVFLIAFIAFAPKENLYFLLLDSLQKEKIIINSKKIEDRYLEFNIQNSDISYQGIDAVNIEELKIKTCLASSKVIIFNISIDDSMKQFLPSKIKTIKASHSILNPLFIDIKINLVQAKAYGVVDILEQKVILNLIPSQQFLKSYKKLLKQMKKQENGEYKIEYKL